MNAAQINVPVPSPNPKAKLSEEIGQFELSYNRRKTERIQRLATVKQQIQKTHHVRTRKKQSIPLYLVNMAIPVILSYLNAYILLGLDVNPDLRASLVISCISLGFFISLFSNLSVGPWRQIVKLYFLIDKLVPHMMAALISLYTLQNFMATGRWYTIWYTALFPIWIFYFAGNIRVIIGYIQMTKWQVLLYKISVLASALIFFYVGFTYMRGAYKITRGKLQSKEDTFKNIIYLYVFGLCELFFNFYKKLSQYDQTDELKYVYQFQDQREQRQKEIFQIQYLQLQKDVMKQDHQDAKFVKMLSNRLIAQKATDQVISTA